MKQEMKMTRFLSVLATWALLSACANNYLGSGGPGSSSGDGSFRKVDMSTSSTSAVDGEPIVKELLLTGSQVNVFSQIVEPGSHFMTYACEVRTFTRSPTLLSSTRELAIDLTDAQQVNCALGLPVNTKIRIEDAGQVNLHAFAGGGDFSISNSSQVNVYLAIRAGTRYRFDAQGLMINQFGCAPYLTTSPTAPVVTIRQAAQVNIYCIDEATADWYLDGLSSPDPIPLKSIDGRLLF